jgi:hypothetical protein
MGLRYNPFTGSFDLTRSPGSYIDGEVAAYSDLPLDAAAAPLNSAWLVRAGSGLWLLTRKPAGIYIRTATGGTDRDADYTYAGTFPRRLQRCEFPSMTTATAPKTSSFQLSGIDTATTRTLTVPNASGTLPLLETANTYTQNQTLDGTNNTAPNQTAASGSSVMTRDALYTALTDNNAGDLIGGASSTINVGAGTASGAFLVTGGFAQVSSTPNSAAGTYIGDGFWSHSVFSGAAMPSNKNLDFVLKGMILRVETNQNWVLRVVVGVGAPNRTPPAVGANALTARGWGIEFYYNGTNYVWRPFYFDSSHNVGSETVLPNMSTAFSQWVGSVFNMRLRQTASGNIEFYINNGDSSRIPAAPAWTQSVTWGATTHGGRHFAIEAATAAATAPTIAARIHYRSAYLQYDP